MNRYSGEGYTGRGYYGPEDQLVFHQDSTSVANDLKEFDRKTELSSAVYTSNQLDLVLTEWKTWSKFVIKSWDLEHLTGISGSIFRVENERTNKRSDDFKFTIIPNGFQRTLRPNMNRLREEVDCDIVSLDSYLVGGIQRYSGSTKDGAIQLIVTGIGNEYQHGWIGIADQMFIPIVNKWQFNSYSANPSWDVSQKITQPMDLFDAIDYQKNR